jgi:predicted ester cyclase
VLDTDFAVDESLVDARMRGAGPSLQFRLLHIFEFRDGLISRENAWRDEMAIQRQLAG